MFAHSFLTPSLLRYLPCHIFSVQDVQLRSLTLTIYIPESISSFHTITGPAVVPRVPLEPLCPQSKLWRVSE